MIYWFTGQPGHGKTNQALKLAHDFKCKGRPVYVCNVRKFLPEKAGMLAMTPEEFKDWHNSLPDGSVVLCDEAYEHGMLPKRAPGAKLPEHVEQLAKHRHRGLDFIFVSQSPDKQVDQFVHDLIERQIHVRRRFGTRYLHRREFDRFERNPEKATPLVIGRTTFYKPAFDWYESTVEDTSERKIPWYFFAFSLGAPLALWLMWYTFGNMGKRLGGGEPQPIPAAAGKATAAPTEPSGDGGKGRELTPVQYIQQFQPRVPTQPWSAPAYDGLQVSREAPRVFCMIGGSPTTGTCSCLTEQGTKYAMETRLCRMVAINGQYEPYRDERDDRRVDGYTQQDIAAERIREVQREQSGAGWNPAAMGADAPAPSPDPLTDADTVTSYGAFRGSP